MVEVNGKIYEINTDTCLGTEKLITRIMQEPENPKNVTYMELILKDILIPTPTTKELNRFRKSIREQIFLEFTEMMVRENDESKKKHSVL